jgi:carbon monoxide dehydrogenase subunit G
MGTIHSTVRIGRPPEAVWAALVDPERFVAWKQGVVSVDRADVPLDRPGATYDVTLSAFGRRVPARFEMREVERPVRLVQVGVTSRGTTTTTNRLRAADAGGTILDFQLRYDLPGGPLGALIDRLVVRRVLEREMDQSHARLRALLEAPA